MKFYEEITYFKTNKLLLSIIGQWPYQKILQRFFLGACAVAVFVSPIQFIILELIDIYRDIHEVIENIPLLIIFVDSCVKYVTIIKNNSKIKELLNIIEKDWTNGKFSPKEYRILHHYDEFGGNWAFYYTVFMYTLSSLYGLAAVSPTILDIIIPLNETRRNNGILPTEQYYLDTTKYFYIFLLHAYVLIFLTMTVHIATDTLFFICVQHACARFHILGERVKNIFQGLDDVEMSENKNCRILINGSNRQHKINDITGKIILCIEEHQNDINFAEDIDSTYSICFFFDVLLATFVIFMAGVQMVLSLNYWYEAVKYAAITLGALIHVYLKGWIGENLIDHSSGISDYIYNASWQNACSKDKHILHLMILRSQKPCTIRAGKLCVLSMASFRTVLKTSLSCFTTLNSIR